MMGSPELKIFRNGEYVAACKYAEDAAMLMHHEGDEIRVGHTKRGIVWREGYEDQPAAESFDHVAEVVAQRRAERRQAARERCANG